MLCLLAAGALPALATSANIRLVDASGNPATGTIRVALYDSAKDKALSGGQLTLYRVAEGKRKNGDLSFEYCGDFYGCGIALGDLTDSTLADQLLEYMPQGARGTTKTVDADGNVTTSAMSEATGTAVSYTGTPEVSYNDKYGDYININLADCDSDWGSNLVAVEYAFFGDVNPDENADAQPVATYGTKIAADFWQKGSGAVIQLGINQSYRHGGTGEAAGEEQNGYWRVTIMSKGYEDYSFVVQSKPAYANDITASLADDNATLTVSGVADEDWANTTVTVDGNEVTGFEGGVAALDSALSVGDHKVVVTVDTYRDNTATVTAMSAMTADDIKLENNTLTITDGDVATFIANVSGVSVNGENLRGKELGSAIFNEDGTVNFEGVVSFHGNDTTVFPNGDKEAYELIITSAGYPVVILTTTAAE